MRHCAAISARKGSRARGSFPGKPRCGACVKSTGKSPRRRSRWPGRRESSVNVALVHDWLTGMRGGENVLEMLCERYPGAELFTLLHVRGSVSPAIERLTIHTSALQRLPGIRHYYRECLPLFPTLIEQFDLSRFDLVISISHCVAKSALKAPNALHICYCLTPMRYA